MKILSFCLFASLIISFTSCETTREINLNADGSGKVNTTIDMSSMIGMAKMAGGGKEMEEAGKKNMDTTITLEKMADSIPNLSPEEKALLRKGTLSFKMNLEEEKFLITTNFPFNNGGQLGQLNGLTGKLIQTAMKDKMGGEGDGGAPQGMPDADMMGGSIDDYFTTTYGKNSIEKKLNADKYAKIEDDKGMQSMKQMAGQGMPMNTTIILNLPKPAKSTTGKNVTLSADKKQVTIKESLDDFFADGKSLEYKIEY